MFLHAFLVDRLWDLLEFLESFFSEGGKVCASAFFYVVFTEYNLVVIAVGCIRQFY